MSTLEHEATHLTRYQQKAEQDEVTQPAQRLRVRAQPAYATVVPIADVEHLLSLGAQRTGC